jgi:hypothetical protein
MESTPLLSILPNLFLLTIMLSSRIWKEIESETEVRELIISNMLLRRMINYI